MVEFRKTAKKTLMARKTFNISMRLPNMSDRLSDVSEADQSQERTGAKESRD